MYGKGEDEGKKKKKKKESERERGRKERRRPVGGMPKSNLEEPPDRFQWSLHCLPAFDI